MLDDILSLDEAAELIGRSPGAMRKAAQRGTLEAKKIGPRYYATTREAVVRYAARVASQRRVRRPPRTM